MKSIVNILAAVTNWLSWLVTKKKEDKKIMVPCPVENEEIFDHLFDHEDQRYISNVSLVKTRSYYSK